MKNITLSLAVMFTLLSATSCLDNEQDKVLILYYSQTGNTRALAQEFQSRLGADIDEIIPTVPYDGTYEQTIARGLEEFEQGILPELKELKCNPSDYDIIFLGYPVWFGTYAPPVSALLEKYDFSGKKIVPFCTFGSGGLDTSSKNLANALDDATVLNGYGVRAARMDAMESEVDQFLKENGYIEGEYVKLEEFPQEHIVTDEESAVFDAAMNGYVMIKAKATHVTQRTIPGGVEYLFTAESLPRDGAPANNASLKVYVKAEDGKAPVFTQVIRP